jgi:2-dehydro-3-deoxyphosphogluconate aldolase/(4S)-4-hydroxy-2-oxoglutarate aldolase
MMFYDMEHRPSCEQLLQYLRRQRVLPVLRSADAAAALDRATQLANAGCGSIELTTSIPDWEAIVAPAKALRVGDGSRLLVGVGTVFTASQAEVALNAGADFIVSPVPAPQVRAVVEREGTVLIEGGLSPGEVASAAARGPAKVFPAHAFGPSYLRSLRTVLPHAALIPTGGISIDEVQSYLDAGAVAVGIGSGLPQEPEALAAVFAGGNN